MALPPLPLVVRTAIIQRLHNQDVVNVVNWRYDDEPVAAQIEQLAGTVASEWDAQVLPLLSFDLTLNRVEARQAVPGGGLGFDFDIVPPAGGESTSQCDNNATSCVVSLRTAFAGRSFRGRLFLGGVPNNAVIDGLLDTTYRTAAAAAVFSFLDTVAAVRGVTPVVVSYFSLGVQRVTPVTTPIVSCISATPYPAGQERRRPGIGG